MTNGSASRSDSRSVEEIQQDIRRTQAEMSRTIDDIQYRLSPEYMKSKAKVRMREISRDTQTRVRSRVKENPAALALIGAGLWMLFRDKDSEHESSYMLGSDYDDDHYHLMVCDVCGSSADASGYIHHDDYTHEMGGRSSSSMKGRVSSRASELKDRASERAERITSSASEKMHDLRDRASSAGERISEKTSRTSEHVSERARRMRERSRYGMMRARSRASSSFEDNPFMLGGIGLVVGALLGAVIPESDRERELMGPARERAMERAREMARERGEQAKDMARAVGEAAMREGKEEARRQMDENRSGSTTGTSFSSDLGTSEFRP